MSLFRRTFSILKPYWRHLLGSSLSSAMYALLSGMLVWLAGPLLMTLFAVTDMGVTGAQPESAISAESASHSAATGRDLPSAVTGEYDFLIKAKNSLKELIGSLVTGSSRQETLFNFCWLILAVGLAANIFLYLQGFFMSFVQQSVVRDFRNRLFEKYHQLSLSFFHRQQTGQLISRVTNDVIVLNETVDLGFNRLVADSLTVLLLSAFLILLSWKLTLLAALILPLVFGFIYIMGKKLRKYSRRTQERMADVNSTLEESISNIRIVKAYAMEKFEIEKFSKATQNYFRSILRMTRIRYLASPVSEILIVGAGVMILLYAGTQILEGKGEMDAGDFMTFIIAMFSLIKPVKTLLSIHIKIQEGLAAAERIFGIIDTPIRVVEIPEAVEKRSFDSSLRYDSVTFAYNGGKPILRDISFELKKGQVLALVGPSGGGKSTLVDLLPRFYDPQAGTITIDGIDIRKIKLESLRRLLGIVTQETYLFNDTIFNNIAYGLNGIPLDDVIDAAKMANADGFIQGFEKKYDTVVGNRGVILSGGQRQRIAIARALLKNPPILIFDEATSALDTESEQQVQEAIDNLMKERTALVIAHRLSTVINAHRILVIDSGRIVESGNHQELLSQDGLYRRLYNMQFRDES
ncbi:MAG: ABC transporter ATP-binding protein [bacterium]|jgi:subfamily B ATP-binding cassette protein MsbA